MEHYKEVVMKKYATATGRASRAEFWYFTLFNIIFSIAASIIDGILGLGRNDSLLTIGTLYGLALLIPSIAVGIRRLHDIGRSGWWMLISLIPIVGTIWLIVLYATKGMPEDNQYGPSTVGNMPPATPQTPVASM